MSEKVVPDNKLLEIIEEYQKKVQEAKTYNTVKILKNFAEKMGYEVYMECYMPTLREYLVFENKEGKMFWDLTTCEYCGNNIPDLIKNI